MLCAAYPLLMTRRAIVNMRRARGLLLALVLGLSQATAWLHAGAISHATCLEHGESIHAGVDASADGTDPAVEASDADRAAADGALAVAHDHCASSALLRWRDIALTAPATGTVPPTIHRSTFHATAPDAVAVAVVYLIAPKTSPPHAGA